MDYRTVEQDGRIIVELVGGAFLKTERDGVDLVGLCAEAGTNLLRLHESNLSSKFFDLRTGLAGAVLLKWSSDRLRAAAVVSAERIGRGKFSEFVRETNRGRQFYVASDRGAAVNWLFKE